MWHELWTMEIPPADKIIRTVVVYAAIVVLLRLAGKREMAQLNTLDLAVMLLLSNVVQNAIIGPDNSLIGGLIGAAVLVSLNAVMVRLGARYTENRPRLARILDGSPTVLVRDGVIDGKALRTEGLRRAEVIAAAQKQNAEHVSDIEEMVLAPAGNLVVRLKPEEESASYRDINELRRQIAALQDSLDRISTTLADPKRGKSELAAISPSGSRGGYGEEVG